MLKCPRDILAVLPKLLLVVLIHELPNAGKQRFLLFRNAALHMEQIGGMLVHEDRVVGQAAHQLITSAETVVQMMLHSMPENLKSVLF